MHIPGLKEDLNVPAESEICPMSDTKKLEKVVTMVTFVYSQIKEITC